MDTFVIFKTVCSMGSTKPDRLSQNNAERGVLRFALLLNGWWCHGSSLRMDHDTNTERQTERQPVEQYHPTLLFIRTPSAGKVMTTVSFGMRGG
jgi:hypothetical protein